MTPHVLVAVDTLEPRHIKIIADSLEGWATWARISPTATDSTYREKLQSAEIVLGLPPAEWLLDSPVRLQQLTTAGYDAYLGKRLDRKPHFTLCNARGVMSVPVAEHCLALMLALTRRIPQHVRDQQARRWRQHAPYDELAGKTACIVGLGDIGIHIAHSCRGLGMAVTGVRRERRPLPGVVDVVYVLDELHRAVATADHVIVVLPADPQTTGVFNAAVFETMRPGAYFYNVGRGSVVDQDALVTHLTDGRLAGAGLDVFDEEPLPDDSPLWQMENVIVSPHVAGRSVREMDRLADLFVTNLTNYREGRPLLNIVSLSP